jgi:hypothetical protein
MNSSKRLWSEQLCSFAQVLLPFPEYNSYYDRRSGRQQHIKAALRKELITSEISEYGYYQGIHVT